MSRNQTMTGIDTGIRSLGASEVGRVGFGAMQLERLADRPEEALSLLARAIEFGVNHIDTAHFYGNGFANEIIRNVSTGSQRIVVATKIGAEATPGARLPFRSAQRPEQLRASVEANLRSLDLEQLPVVNLRRLDIRPGLTADGDQIVDIDVQLAAMIEMRDERKIGAIGVSAADLENLRRAIPAGIVCVQNAYSLLSRQYEVMLDFCCEHGIAWVPFFPLGGAHFPGWPNVTDHPKVIEIAAEMAVTPSQLGLAWLLAHRPNILLIPGTANSSHLQENIDSAAVSLGDDVRFALDALGDATFESMKEDAR